MKGNGIRAFVVGVTLTVVPSIVCADGGEFRFPGSGAPSRGYSAGGSSSGEYSGPVVRPNSAALGHYARARSMLVEALREYERGRSIAQPDMVFDGNQWRAGIVSRAEDLTRLLDPKPREVETGVRFRENPYLLNEERGVQPQAEIPAPAVKKAPAKVKVESEEGVRARFSTKPTAELEPTPAKKVLQAPKKIEEKVEVIEKDEETKRVEKEVDSEIERAVELGKMGKAANEPKSEINKKVSEKSETDEGDDVSSDSIDDEDSEVAAKSLSDDEIRERLEKLQKEIAEEEKSVNKMDKGNK